MEHILICEYKFDNISILKILKSSSKNIDGMKNGKSLFLFFNAIWFSQLFRSHERAFTLTHKAGIALILTVCDLCYLFR